MDKIRADVNNNGAMWVDRLLGEECVSPDGTWMPESNPNLDLVTVLARIQEMFNVTGIEWLAQNWPFDARMMTSDGITLPWERMEDTQALSVFTDPRPLDLWDDKLRDGLGGFVHGGHSLKHLGEVWCDIPADLQDELKQAQRALGEGSAMLWDYSMLPLKTAISPYACMDTRLLLKMAAICRERAPFQEQQTKDL